MNTITRLKDAGFTIGAAEHAVNCTWVESAEPFWYYNPKFAKSITEVHISLRKATPSTTGYGITLAGSFAETDMLPFNLLDARQKEALDDAYGRYVRHQEHITYHRDAMDKAEADFMHELDSDMCPF